MWAEGATLPGGCTSGRSQTSRGNFSEVWESAVPPASSLGCGGLLAADNAECSVPAAQAGPARCPSARLGPCPRVPVMCRLRGRAGPAAALWRLRPHRRRCGGSRGPSGGGARSPRAPRRERDLFSRPCHSLDAFDSWRGLSACCSAGWGTSSIGGSEPRAWCSSGSAGHCLTSSLVMTGDGEHPSGQPAGRSRTPPGP